VAATAAGKHKANRMAALATDSTIHQRCNVRPSMFVPECASQIHTILWHNVDLCTAQGEAVRSHDQVKGCGCCGTQLFTRLRHVPQIASSLLSSPTLATENTSNNSLHDKCSLSHLLAVPTIGTCYSGCVICFVAACAYLRMRTLPGIGHPSLYIHVQCP
jgi:hypothetical protein